MTPGRVSRRGRGPVDPVRGGLDLARPGPGRRDRPGALLDRAGRLGRGAGGPAPSSGSRRPSWRGTTRTSPTGSAGSSRWSTGPGSASGCRSTSGGRPSSAGSGTPSGRSRPARRRPMPRSPARSADPRRSGPWPAPAPRTSWRSRSPAIGSSGATAAWAVIAGGSIASGRCSRRRRKKEGSVVSGGSRELSPTTAMGSITRGRSRQPGPESGSSRRGGPAGGGWRAGRPGLGGGRSS